VLICLASRNASSQLGLKTEAALKTSMLSLNRRSNSDSILSIVTNNTSIFRVSRGQRVAELLCPIDDDTKNVFSLELAEIVREGLSCQTVIPVSTPSLSASSTISDHDVSVQVEVHNGDK